METKTDLVKFVLFFKNVHDDEVESLLDLLKKFDFSITNEEFSEIVENNEFSVYMFNTDFSSYKQLSSVFTSLHIHHNILYNQDYF